jgi:type II secretory pathway pseudopilin PulG
MHLRNQKGITLIEMIMFIVVAAVAIPAIVCPVLSLLKESTKPEKAVTANFLGQQILEVITSNDFPTLSDTSGPLPIPKTPVKNAINARIDASWPSGYTYVWGVHYITEGDLETEQASATNYVRINITVTDPDGANYSYYSIVTKRRRDAPAG